MQRWRPDPTVLGGMRACGEMEGGVFVEWHFVQHALAEKDTEIAKWKAAHDEMVSRNRLLRDRPDLPADRIRAHDEWVRKVAEKEAELARWKARSWDDNVRFIAEAKENLLKEYIHLTELYGEQKHEIRKLKADYQQLMENERKP